MIEWRQVKAVLPLQGRIHSAAGGWQLPAQGLEQDSLVNSIRAVE